MIGFFEWGMDYQFPSGKKVKQSQIMFLPLLRKKATGEVNFSIGAPTLQRESSLDPTYNLSKIFEVLKTRSNFTGFGLYQHELFSKLAYLMTKTPDVNRCMSASVPEVVRRRRKPSTIFAPEKPRMMELWKRRQTVQRSRRFIFFCLQRDGQTAHQTCSLAHFPYRKGTGRSGSEVGSSDFREVGRPVWKLNFFFRAERRKRPNPASFQSRLRGECCICQRFGSIPKGT